ncbi:MAG: hypothetical protein KA792_03620 [Bacteroidales bacterium]|nr:hypothetical protein [Bacteroidales bacterium]
MSEKIILGIHIPERIQEAVQIQDILTKFGCSIKTRLGLHEASENYCSPCGLILLELAGDTNECAKLEKELRKIKGADIQKMSFKC